MNFNFNETNIITGYIKELLRDFNLPVYSVYKDSRKHTGRLYINKDKVVKYNGTTLENVGSYVYNKKYNNFTKNFIINSSVYDAYTHTYLGNYLRFLRDYKNINLMSLYNCFNTETPVGLNYTLDIDGYSYIVDTTDTRYNYYIVPAKFDEDYTINIDTLAPYEISCIIYNGDTVLDISKELSKLTFKKINSNSKHYPFIYSTKNITFENEEYAANYWKYENNLRILLKLPKVINTSISILEGNYLANCNICGNTVINKLYLDDTTPTIDAISKLSLLTNTTKTYPFADRLVEYLTGNAITNLETIPTNISRVQDILLENLYFSDSSLEKDKTLVFKGYYDIWDDFIRTNILRKLETVVDDANVKKCYYTLLNYDNTSKSYIYSKEDYSQFRPIDEYYDLLGYVDKDTEANLSLKTTVNTTNIKEI